MKLLTKLNNRHCQIFAIATTFLLSACGGDGSNYGTTTTPVAAATPHVILTIPAKTVPIVTGVAGNSLIKAKFNQDMLASTINTSSFTLNCPAGTPITSTVTYDAPNKTAILKPTSSISSLPSSPNCEAKITTAVKNLAGVAKTTDYVWSFTPGADDVIAPTNIARSPTNGATNVCLTKVVSVTFSEPMDSSTINSTSFTVDTGLSTAAVPGTVTYDALSNTASFTTTSSAGFAPSTLHRVVISPDVKDLAGLSISPFSYGFRTGTLACGSALVNLGTVAAYGGFGGNAGVTNSGVETVVNGDLGTTAACTLFTGFHDEANVYTETPLNVGLVTGDIYCDAPPPGTVEKLVIATQALADARTAFTTMENLASTPIADSELGNTTVTAGIYNSAAGFFDITAGPLTLDANNDSDAIWIFKTDTSLTVGASIQVLLINGAQAKNVFWQVGSAARLEDGSAMVGTIIASAGVTISTAGQTNQTTLIGRAIGLNASVTMVNTTVTVP